VGVKKPLKPNDLRRAWRPARRNRKKKIWISKWPTQRRDNPGGSSEQPRRPQRRRGEGGNCQGIQSKIRRPEKGNAHRNGGIKIKPGANIESEEPLMPKRSRDKRREKRFPSVKLH